MLIEAEQKRREREERLLLTHAWHTGYFGRVDKLPRLEKILGATGPRREARAQTPEEMLEWAKVFTVAHGGKVVKRGEGASSGSTESSPAVTTPSQG